MRTRVNALTPFQGLRGSLFILIVLALGAVAAPSLGQDNGDLPVRIDPQRDGQAYPVSSVVFEYTIDHPDLPDLMFLGDVEVELVHTGEGLVAPVEGADTEMVAIKQLGRPGYTVVYRSALALILQRIRDALEEDAGLLGHLVTPSPDEIAYESTGNDLRAPGQEILTVRVWPVLVNQVRTVARGDRIAEDEDEGEVSNVDHPKHAYVSRRFDLGSGDLLTGPGVDAEVHRMNRHPGRRADVSISPSESRGEVVVDYLINEPKQWAVYARVSNTGTKSTDEWREQFGFIHRQLTGKDDILQIDFVTATFDETNALLASYEFDVGDRMRLKVFGRWNEFRSSDVGLGQEVFKGDGYEVGAELFSTVWEDGPKRIELFGGVRFEHVEVENLVIVLNGEEDFFLPFAGFRFIKNTPTHSAFAEVRVETNLASVADTSETMIGALGRALADNEFTVLKAQMTHSFFLEPIFDPAGFRGDRGMDEMQLAHEMVLRVRGQTGFGSRLTSTFQHVAGGAASVRGYDESIAAGDDAVVGTLEYRYHMGRATPISQETGELFGAPFRSARTRPFGSADWNVILSAFVDIGRVSVQSALPFENDETLVGAGVGVEAQLKRNITLNLDYGMAFTRIGEQNPTGPVNVGDSKLHFAATLVF